MVVIDPYNWTGTNAVLSGKKMWKVFSSFTYIVSQVKV